MNRVGIDNELFSAFDVSWISRREAKPSKLAPSEFPLKSTEKSKPSKKFVSKTVVYKEKNKPAKVKWTSLQEEEIKDAQNEDSLVTGLALSLDTVEPVEELQLASGEGSGVEVCRTEKSPLQADETVSEGNRITDDDNTRSEEGARAGNEKKGKIKIDKEEPQKKQEDKKKNHFKKWDS